MKSVRIRSSYSVSLRIQSECGKMRTRKTPNTDAFHVVRFMLKCKNSSANPWRYISMAKTRKVTCHKITQK